MNPLVNSCLLLLTFWKEITMPMKDRALSHRTFEQFSMGVVYGDFFWASSYCRIWITAKKHPLSAHERMSTPAKTIQAYLRLKAENCRDLELKPLLCRAQWRVGKSSARFRHEISVQKDKTYWRYRSKDEDLIIRILKQKEDFLALTRSHGTRVMWILRRESTLP